MTWTYGRGAVEIDMARLFDEFTEDQRLEAIELLMDRVEFYGEVARVREVVNAPRYDE